MATRALDIVTILHALSVLEGELGITEWNSYNDQQRQIFAWLEGNRELLAKITGLDAKASRFWQELNKFLTDRKFDPMVEPFDPTQGIGVVSIIDKLVKWLNGPGSLVQIPTTQGVRPGFELPADGVNIYEIAGFPGSCLLQLLTKSDDTLWLFVHQDNSLEDLEMVKLAMEVISGTRMTPMRQGWGGEKYPAFAGAQVPMVDFDVKPDISWLCGADTRAENGDDYFIAQASQQFKMRMDETGARVKVATVIVAMRGMVQEPVVFVLDRPFYGWWTQKGIPLPMAVFYADWDALHKPEGSLEDL